MFINVKIDDGCLRLFDRITRDSTPAGERAASMNLLRKRIIKLNKLDGASNTRIHKYVRVAFAKYYKRAAY